jgi:ribosomal protein S18 acetylase RimI-like enzyme
LVIRDCREGDVDAMSWATSAGQRREWHEQLARAARGEVVYLVAELDGGVVGKAVLDWVHEADGTPWLWMVSVDPAHRGLGVGTAMLAEAERRCRERGFTVLECAVDEDNPRALALYLRLGYDEVGAHTDEYDVAAEDGIVTRVSKPGRRLRKALAL